MLLQSPVWELELTCSPIKETPEKVTPEAPRPIGGKTSRQLFPKDYRENQAPIGQPRGSGHLAQLASGRPVRAKLAPRQALVSRTQPYHPPKMQKGQISIFQETDVRHFIFLKPSVVPGLLQFLFRTIRSRATTLDQNRR